MLDLRATLYASAGAGVATLGLALALVGPGTALLVPDWPDPGRIWLLAGAVFAVFGIMGAAFAAIRAQRGATAWDGVLAALIAAGLPVAGVLLPWLGLVGSWAASGPGAGRRLALAEAVVALLGWVPAAGVGILVAVGAIGGLAARALGAPWAGRPRPEGLSWFPPALLPSTAWLVVAAGASMVPLGRTVTDALTRTGVEGAAALGVLVTTLSPALLLGVQAAAGTVQARQAVIAWGRGQRAAPLLVAAASLLVLLAQATALGLAARWGLALVTLAVPGASAVLGVVWLRLRPAGPALLGPRRAGDLIARLLQQALLTAIALLGVGPLVAAVMTWSLLLPVASTPATPAERVLGWWQAVAVADLAAVSGPLILGLLVVGPRWLLRAWRERRRQAQAAEG